MRVESFKRRHRAAGRLALYGAALVLAALIGLASTLAPHFGTLDSDQSWAEIDWEADPAVQLLQEYVRIDTSSPAGSEIAGARFLAAQLETVGIEAHIEPMGERGANLWAIIEGEDPRALVLHHHIDVTPPGDVALWAHPPFAAEVDPPWIHGRGVFDMKSVAIAQLLAFEAVARRPTRPRRSLILLATGSEETGSELGTRWVLRQHPELVSRIWAVLTEGGVVEATDLDTIKYWGIEFAQKRFVPGYACSSSRERLEALRLDLERLGKPGHPTSLAPEVETFLAAYWPSRDHPLYKEILGDPRSLAANWPRFHRLPGLFQSLFRDEIVPFGVEEDPEGGFRMKILLHLVPGSDGTAIRRLLEAPWLTGDVSLAFDQPLGADHGSPPDHPAAVQVMDSIRAKYPQATVGPYFLPWTATDSRFFRQAGIPSYGFSPFLIMSTDTFRVDAVNEHIALPGFVGGVDLYADVVQHLVD